jgi:hypothetical protein
LAITLDLTTWAYPGTITTVELRRPLARRLRITHPAGSGSCPVPSLGPPRAVSSLPSPCSLRSARPTCFRNSWSSSLPPISGNCGYPRGPGRPHCRCFLETAAIQAEMAAVSGKLRSSTEQRSPPWPCFPETAAIPAEMTAVSGKLRSFARAGRVDNRSFPEGRHVG